MSDLFRQSIYSRLAGYEDTNDAERLAEDRTFRMLVSRERRETSVAVTSTLDWFETDVLTKERNYQGLARLVLHPAVGRQPVDSAPICADHPAHRAARVASDVFEMAGRGERETARSWRSISRPDGGREQTFGRWAVSPAGAAGKPM